MSAVRSLLWFFNKFSIIVGGNDASLLPWFNRQSTKHMDKEEKYLVIGSNNFWYAIDDTLKEATQTAKSVKKDSSGYADPETGNEPEKPKEVFIYQALLIKTI